MGRLLFVEQLKEYVQSSKYGHELSYLLALTILQIIVYSDVIGLFVYDITYVTHNHKTHIHNTSMLCRNYLLGSLLVFGNEIAMAVHWQSVCHEENSPAKWNNNNYLINKTASQTLAHTRTNTLVKSNHNQHNISVWYFRVNSEHFLFEFFLQL